MGKYEDDRMAEEFIQYMATHPEEDPLRDGFSSGGGKNSWCLVILGIIGMILLSPILIIMLALGICPEKK